ncbi:methionine ABC transporter ATP-binding protein [Noviherbaspirillum malthae]|uniref:methionine ABC transporter ATP-binding protein n=1 Tax=Noviherbaspirillum malthae TaxID=1260987 RepID=UPI0018904833|nr:ATP-binding cassette domain-containing protein [Noviherbaspirillum malthae]
MVLLEHVSKTFQSNKKEISALRDVKLHVRAGEIYGIIGRSGAGKSTLLRTINLLERPTAGRVCIDGLDITTLDGSKLADLRQSIGMVFQSFNLLNAKTVAQNIEFPLKLAGRLSRAEREARVTELLDLVGLQDQREKYPSQLSGGQKQRVGIARAIAHHPKLLLCDEATSALDPETTQSILDLLADINRRLGLTIVLITHEMSVIRRLCDRVAVIDKGEIVEQGDVADVFLHPVHPVTQGLVNESNESLAAEGGVHAVQRKAAGATRARITYRGDAVYQPLIGEIEARSGKRVAILQGVVSSMKDTPYAQLLVELSDNGAAGNPATGESVADVMQALGIRYEVLHD